MSGTSNLNSLSKAGVAMEIRQELREKFEPRDYKKFKGQFLPKKAIEDVLTPDKIQLILRSTLETKDIDLENVTGRKQRIKLFIILLLAEEIGYLKHLIDHGVSDDDLPLEKDHQSLAPCSGRERVIMDTFLHLQFKVCVPVLDFSADKICVEQFHEKQSLPFSLKSELGKGGQGRIWRIKIPPEHLKKTRHPSNLWGPFHKGPSFALKEFSNRNDFDRELNALNHFNRDEPHNEHENLIKLLSAYSQGDKYFMIFPLAKGNLDKFWQEANSRYKDPSWLLEQCCRLVEGLCKIHQYQIEPGNTSSNEKVSVGRHGDIKPQNILWFRDSSASATDDRLVLSDFTLMRFHKEDCDTVTTIGHIGYTQTYRAPEIAYKSHQHADQKYDVWSIGCVFLEFISCHLVGYDATRGELFRGDDGRYYQSFTTARFMEYSNDVKHCCREDNYFRFERSTGKAQVKNSVIQWISYLQGMELCSGSFEKFLGLIQHCMLVPEPNLRWSISEVLEYLAGILDQNREGAHSKASCPAFRLWKTDSDHRFPALWNNSDRRPQRPQRQSTSMQADWTSSTHSPTPPPFMTTEYPTNSARRQNHVG